jgi:hypothetical protein
MKLPFVHRQAVVRVCAQHALVIAQPQCIRLMKAGLLTRLSREDMDWELGLVEPTDIQYPFSFSRQERMSRYDALYNASDMVVFAIPNGLRIGWSRSANLFLHYHFDYRHIYAHNRMEDLLNYPPFPDDCGDGCEGGCEVCEPMEVSCLRQGVDIFTAADLRTAIRKTYFVQFVLPPALANKVL